MSLKTIVQSIRAARHIDLILLIVLACVLGLLLYGGTDRSPAGKTDTEARLERLLEGMDGVGDVDAMISLDGDGNPVGAAVVAGGELGVRERLEIQSAIKALLDIDLQRIRVIGKGGSEG